MNDEWNDVRENMTNYRLECGTMIKKCVVTNLISMEFFLLLIIQADWKRIKIFFDRNSRFLMMILSNKSNQIKLN